MKVQASLEIVLIIFLVLLLFNFTLYLVNLKLEESEVSIQIAKARMFSDELKSAISLVSSQRGTSRKVIKVDLSRGLEVTTPQPNLLSIKINIDGRQEQFFIFSSLPIKLKIPRRPTPGEREIIVTLENDSVEIRELRDLLEFEPHFIYLDVTKNSSRSLNFTLYCYSDQSGNISFIKAGELANYVYVDEIVSELNNCTMISNACYNDSNLLFQNLPDSYSTPKFGFLQLRGSVLKICLIDSKDDGRAEYDKIYILPPDETDSTNGDHSSINQTLHIFGGSFKIFDIGTDFSYLKMERIGIQRRGDESSSELFLNISVPLIPAGRYGATLIAELENSSSSLDILLNVLSLPIQSMQIFLSNSSDLSIETTRFWKNSTFFYKVKATDTFGNPGEGEVEIRILNPLGETLHAKLEKFNSLGEVNGSIFLTDASPSGKWNFMAIIPEKNYFETKEFEVIGKPEFIKIFTFSDDELKTEVNSFARGKDVYYLVEVLDNESYPTDGLLNISFFEPSGDLASSKLVYVRGTYNDSFHLPLDAELGRWKIKVREVNSDLSGNITFYVVKNILVHNAYIVTDKVEYVSGDMIKIKMSVIDQNFQPFPNLGNRIHVDVRRSEGNPDFSFTGDDMSYQCLGVFKCPLSVSCCYVYEFNSSILLSGKVYFLDVKITDPVKELISIYESRSFKVIP